MPQWKKTILLTDENIFSGIGGGQTSYNTIINNTPEYLYYCPAINIKNTQVVPNNVILFKKFEFFNKNNYDMKYDYMYESYIYCMNIAFSLKVFDENLEFDIIDMPDYSPSCLFIGEALKAAKVEYKHLCVAMHGTLVAALQHVWPPARPDRRNRFRVWQTSNLMYRSADQRYALSKKYADDWSRATGIEPTLVDPICFINTPAPSTSIGGSEAKPKLVFAGRMERLKGPDIAIDMAWSIPSHLYDGLLLIGSDQVDQSIGNSRECLTRLAIDRNVDIKFTGALKQKQLHEHFQQRSILILPSVFDTFNLVALEALSLGCPVFVSKQMGFSAWLKDAIPELRHLILDFDCSRQGSELIRDYLVNYDARRERIVESVNNYIVRHKCNNIYGVYNDFTNFDGKSRKTVSRIFDLMHSFTRFDVNEDALEANGKKIKCLLSSTIFQAELLYNDAFNKQNGWDITEDEIINRGSINTTSSNTNSSVKKYFNRFLGKKESQEKTPEKSPFSSNPLFSPNWYLQKYLDVKLSSMDPWHHYFTYGAREKRLPHPLLEGLNPWAWDAFSSSPFSFMKAARILVDRANLDGDHHQRDVNSLMVDFVNSISVVCGSYDANGNNKLKNKKKYHEHDAKEYLNNLCSDLSNMRVGRALSYREMAISAKRLGDHVLSAAYYLRAFRLQGEDKHDELPYVMSALRGAGFEQEAQVAQAMYQDITRSAVRVHDYLQAQELSQMRNVLSPAVIVDDRRLSNIPKCSIIVSMYKAGDKLNTLLTSIEQQTLEKSNIEIILVDSNSPSNEREIFLDNARKNLNSMIYIRSENRETIQHAWNRGIELARGQYLTFLGCDESMHPECLSKLSNYLDLNKNVDWVTADSVVTNVDKRGRYIDDVMRYNRSEYHHQVTRLDTCYMNYVGGMYRKSIHDKYGYYDKSFRGAGDTEFKMRILRHINSSNYAELLGVFNNYPEERTTQSPLAEIEDLRAWYIHRTTGGIAYGFQNKSNDEIEELFRCALGYRKSFCQHQSSDFDLAHSIASYWVSRPDCGVRAQKAKITADRLIALVRNVDCRFPIGAPSSEGAAIAASITEKLASYSRQDAETFGLSNPPIYRIWNDNRHEQHSFPWFPKG